MVDSELCTGCLACAGICNYNAIEVKKDEKGFLYPFKIQERCVGCNLCEKVCPQLNTRSDKTVSDTYIFKANDNKRKQSQSGAGFSVVADYILSLGGVVYGVKLDGSNHCIYSRIDSVTTLEEIKKAKYVQANIVGIHGQVEKDLIQGKIVLFSGTPCYVDGLRRYIQLKKLNTEKLYLVDIICHGVPSPKVFEDYLEFYSSSHKNQRIKNFNFRDKRYGWYGHVTIDIGNKIMVNDDYNSIFYSRYAHRESCFLCRYSNLNRPGDITFGDAWGIEKIDADFDDNKGVSLVMINTPKGKKLWSSIRDDSQTKEINIKDFLQPNLIKPTPRPQKYQEFWMKYLAEGFAKTVEYYCFANGRFAEYEYIPRNALLKRVNRKIQNTLFRKETKLNENCGNNSI